MQSDLILDFSERKSILLRDIRSVDWGRQTPQFHLNTKLSHLVTEGCLSSPGWQESCEKFVASLPRIVVTCGWRNERVDPFRGAREAFPSNRKGELGDLVTHVLAMWGFARAYEGTSHSGLSHGNLLEILEMSGILNGGESRSFYLDVLGLERSPAEEIDELLTEVEGEAICEGGEPVRIEGGGVLYRSSGGRNILWEETAGGTYLSTEGYGCICRWRVLHSSGAAVVVQSARAVHTSVTNLAEIVRDACRSRFGARVKCYEFYESMAGESLRSPCEITGESGERAGWIPAPIDSLPILADWLRGDRI